MALTLIANLKKADPTARTPDGRFVSTRRRPELRRAMACQWRYCHNRALEATDLYCPKHAEIVDQQLATAATFKPWTVVCWLCSARRDESWTRERKELLVKAGYPWLRCDQCGSGTVGVEAFDAHDNDKSTVVRDVNLPHVRLVH